MISIKISLAVSISSLRYLLDFPTYSYLLSWEVWQTCYKINRVDRSKVRPLHCTVRVTLGALLFLNHIWSEIGWTFGMLKQGRYSGKEQKTCLSLVWSMKVLCSPLNAQAVPRARTDPGIRELSKQPVDRWALPASRKNTSCSAFTFLSLTSPNPL